MNQILLSLIALALAVSLTAIGFIHGTYAAGGSDSSCYVLMAQAFASGNIQPTSSLAAHVPWPDAAKTFTPGGFVPSETNLSASSPVCAPGFSVLLATAAAVGGLRAVFWVTPVAGGLLVWLTYLAGRRFGGPMAGVMAAALVSASPPVLYQVVQPMNDITTAALWIAVFVALSDRRWVLAGLCCGLALLVRPNLLPLAAVAGIFVLTAHPIPNPRLLTRRTARFCVAVLPFVFAVLWLNNRLYGSPVSTGYGQPAVLFDLSFVPVNAVRYGGWLVDTHTAFPLFAIAAPFVIGGEKRQDVLLAVGLIASTTATYLVYKPFDDWSYLRFLLPAIPLLLVLASAVAVTLLKSLFAKWRWATTPRAVCEYGAVSALTVLLAVFCVRAAHDRHAFALQFLEQRYRSAGIVVRDRLPSGAVVLSVWDSGAVRFHGRKEALSWEGLDPEWLDRSLSWLAERGRKPYILVESWEEPGFRGRFGNQSDSGKLDWPPKYEVDRMIRIYDPQDRARYHRGERVDTEFLWPLND